MDGWTVATVVPDAEVSPIEVDLEYTEYTVIADLSSEEALSKIIYFVAPEDYAGKKLHSYGGHLTYTILYNSGIFGTTSTTTIVLLISQCVF